MKFDVNNDGSEQLAAKAVEEKLADLPDQPGVYVFLGSERSVLYVGKASSLRSRVRSYFQKGRSDTRYFVERLVNEVLDIETFVVGSEKEAALLENAMIKDRKPRYNFKLRDDKEFLSIRLDPQEAWPRLRVIRRTKDDGANYFGPYDSASAARQTLRLVNRHFKLRTCRDSDFAKRTRPCLEYQIKRCHAPCVFPVDRGRYGDQVRFASLFLEGRQDALVKEVEAQMRDAAEKLDYERAAELRDQLRSLHRVREVQHVAVADSVDQDVFGIYSEADDSELAVVEVRGGRMTRVHTFAAKSVLPESEILGSFLMSHYSGGRDAPDEVLLPQPVELQEALGQILGDKKGRKVSILEPKRGHRVRVLELAHENAKHAFLEKRRKRDSTDDKLVSFQKTMRLAGLPRVVECVDISHIGGDDTVAGLVTLVDGELDRSRYRSFTLKGYGGDDFQAMREVVSRRFAKVGQPGWDAPDLFVVDGGMGQLQVALAALSDLKLNVSVVGLAKERVATDLSVPDKRERVYFPNQKNPVILADRSAAKFFLVRLRDEAHRFSNYARTRLGKRRTLRSQLEGLDGIGPVTRTKLFSHFGDVRQVLGASDAELERVGLSPRQILSLRTALGPLTSAPQGGESLAVADIDSQAVDFGEAFDEPLGEDAEYTEAESSEQTGALGDDAGDDEVKS